MFHNLVVDTVFWPAGMRLLLFFVAPAVIMLQAARWLVEVPLYAEYRITTARRARGGTATSETFGQAASVLARSSASMASSASALLVFGFVVAVLSWLGSALHGSQLHSITHTIDGWWSAYARHVGVV